MPRDHATIALAATLPRHGANDSPRELELHQRERAMADVLDRLDRLAHEGRVVAALLGGGRG
jgi:hypothetical protein